jgi:hypothetical protein
MTAVVFVNFEAWFVGPKGNSPSPAQRRERAAHKGEFLSVKGHKLSMTSPLNTLTQWPYCGDAVSQKRIDEHMTKRCPKAPREVVTIEPTSRTGAVVVFVGLALV